MSTQPNDAEPVDEVVLIDDIGDIEDIGDIGDISDIETQLGDLDIDVAEKEATA